MEKINDFSCCDSCGTGCRKSRSGSCNNTIWLAGACPGSKVRIQDTCNTFTQERTQNLCQIESTVLHQLFRNPNQLAGVLVSIQCDRSKDHILFAHLGVFGKNGTCIAGVIHRGPWQIIPRIRPDNRTYLPHTAKRQQRPFQLEYKALWNRVTACTVGGALRS